MCKALSFLVLFMTFFFAACCKQTDNRRTLIVAHRGASYLAPENTVASTKLAFEKGADISEIDVYLSKDNRIMVLHDETTKRTSGVDLKVSETDSETLRTLDVGKFKSEAYAGEKIPFIEEIINVIPEGKKLFIEIKCGPEIAPYLRQVIETGGKKEQMVIISENLDAMTACKKLMPYIPMYWIKETQKDIKTGCYQPYDISIIEQAVGNGLAGLDLHYEGLNKVFIQRAHKAGLKIYVWTVDDVHEAKRMMEYGVNGITTDMPGTMRAELKI